MKAWRRFAVLIAAANLSLNAPNVAHAQTDDPMELKLNKLISELDVLSSSVQIDQRILENTISTYIREASDPNAQVAEVGLILSEGNQRIPGLDVKYLSSNDYCKVLKRLQDWRQRLGLRLVEVLDQKLRVMEVRHLYQATKLRYDMEQFRGEPFNKQDLREIYQRAMIDLQIETPSASELQTGWGASDGEEVQAILNRLEDIVQDPCG